MKTNLQITKSILIIVMVLFFSHSNYAQTILDEKFEGTAMPPGWVFQSTLTDQNTWAFYDIYDDLEVYESNTTPQNEWVISPSFDLSNYSNLYLTFSPWMYFNQSDFVSDTMDYKILISTDGGNLWTELWSDDQLSLNDFDGSFFYFRTISKSIQNYCGLGMNNIKIGFQFTSNGTGLNNNFVALMDVKISSDCPTTTISSATPGFVSWFAIDNFSGTFDLEFGPVGFVQGTGTFVSNLSGNSFQFGSPMCKYDCYLKSNCGGSSSEWNMVGFRNNVQSLSSSNTTATTSQINWTGYSSNYDLEYGINNFVVGNGNLISNIGGNSYYLSGLIPNTVYRYFIRTNCDGVFGGWKSKTFTTTTLSTKEVEFENDIIVFPNPTSDFVNIKSKFAKIGRIELYDNLGRLVAFYDNNGTLDFTSFENGVYFAKIEAKEATRILKIVKN